MTEETVGINSRAACLVDGPVDDYESWDGEPFSEIHQTEEALCVPRSRVLILKCASCTSRTYRTEAIDNNSREVMLLMSGAWKT